MITKTGLMLFILLGAAVVAAFGVWFAFKAYEGWKSTDDEGESGWVMLGSALSLTCFIVLVKLAYHLASAV